MGVDPVLLTPAVYDNVDRTSYTTASVSPTANRWLVVDSAGRHATANDVAPIVSGLSLSWTQEHSLRSESLGGGFPARISRDYAWTGAAPGSGTLTISWGATTSIGTAWIVYELGPDVDSSDPFVQTVSDDGGTGATSITVSLAAFGSGNNRPLICAFHDVNEVNTPEAGYTEIGDVAGTAGNLSFAAAFHPSTPDTTPSYSWTTSTSLRVGVASEIKAGAGGGAVVVRRSLLGVGV